MYNSKRYNMYNSKAKQNHQRFGFDIY